MCTFFSETPSHHLAFPAVNMSKIGINGFGRIGRLVLRAALLKGAEVSIRPSLLFFSPLFFFSESWRKCRSAAADGHCIFIQVLTYRVIFVH